MTEIKNTRTILIAMLVFQPILFGLVIFGVDYYRDVQRLNFLANSFRHAAEASEIQPLQQIVARMDGKQITREEENTTTQYATPDDIKDPVLRNALLSYVEWEPTYNSAYYKDRFENGTTIFTNELDSASIEVISIPTNRADFLNDISAKYVIKVLGKAHRFQSRDNNWKSWTTGGEAHIQVLIQHGEPVVSPGKQTPDIIPYN